MTAQKASYGIDYLNHAQPKDVMRWIYENFDSILMRDAFMLNAHLPSNKLTIPCHQFAASVVGRLEACVRKFHNFPIELFSYDVERNELNILFEEDYLYTFSLPINPFHDMTMPDGSPRTSCTREEFEAWRKELEA